jgi:hypothetical protein
MMTPLEINALSRTTREINDISVWVCSDCGMDEGLEDAFHTGATKQINWPITRTFEFFIKETNLNSVNWRMKANRLMNEVDGND